MENSLSTTNELSDNCPYCGGAGRVHPIRNGAIVYSETIMCSCIKKESEEKHRQLIIKSCNLPPFADTMTFKNFKLVPGTESAFNKAKAIAGKPNELFWLALIGDNGNGKTHLAVTICKAWLEAGIPARYILTSLLLEELREGFKHEREGDYELSYTRKFNYYCNVPLLLLDDYGLESKTSWVQEKLDTLVDYRLMNNLSLLVTSNSTLDEMPPRIRSRIMRHPKGEIIGISAGDYSLRGRYE